MESLILAQNERWRRVLNMQVERELQCLHRRDSGERVSNTWIICLLVGDNLGKPGLIPNNMAFTQVEAIKGGDLRAYLQKMSLRPISLLVG
jgi:hypothetical protein